MKTLNILDSKKILEKFGVKFARSGLAKSVDEALMAANSIGYPVVIKVVSHEISHKTDAGGVVVGIRNDVELQESFRKMMGRVKKKFPRAKISGVVVQKMVEGGADVLIGGKRDPQFGQVIAFGLGGIFVELMDDVAFRLAPINKKEALEMMAETRGFKILEGYRGSSYDIDAIASLIVKVSRMLDKRKDIVELDINPVIALKKDAVAVDARIVIGD